MTSAVHRFGQVDFDAQSGKLSINGEAVELDRSSAAILGCLMSGHGAEVGKEELLLAGWPGRIVHENSLAKAISRLRKVLSPAGASLEAVYGRGYRLELPAAELVQDRRAVAPRKAVSKWPRPLWLAGLLVGLVALATAGWALWPKVERPRDLVIGDPPGSIGKILWVDDHPQNNIAEARAFTEQHIAVHNVRTTAEALTLLSMYHYNLIISDMGRGEDRLAGLKLIREIRARGDRTPALIYTVRADGAAAQEQQRDHVADAGAQGLVVTPDEVRSTVTRMFAPLAGP